MAGPGGRQGQKIGAKRALIGSAIGPERSSRLPIGSEALVVRHRVLDDKSLDPLRMGQGHAITYRAAVVLHVRGVA